MKFHLISETIDGSIKDIVQLKTLDSSLEYSQMFDALEDCPKDFQAKLIQALNSVGETIQVSPVDVFNIVLCASNEEDDKDATKKMYNWWKAVFEILSKCDIPDDRKAEYDDLVDTLMAEVSKAGDDAQVNEAEDYGYEQANIEDEEVMLKDMEFAISKIGEIANRVQDLINFVNPYCQLVKESSGEFYLEDVREDYLLGRITDEEMEDAINGIGDIYEDMKPKFISSLKELKDEFMSYVDAANAGSSSALTLLCGLVSRLKITTVFGFDKWWDKCPLNKHNEFNEDNMMKFKNIDESGKRFGCRTSALTNHRTNEIKKMYVSGRISEDEAFEQLSEIGRDDSTAEMLIDRWNSDYGINESKENELGNERVKVTYYLPEDYKDDPNDDSWITTKETLGEICGDWYGGNFNTEQKEGELVYRVSGPDGYNYFKFDNPEDEKKFLSYSARLRCEPNEIDSPSEGGSYRIEPDIGENDEGVFAVYFKKYELGDEDWEYQKTFDTEDEAFAWVNEQVSGKMDDSKHVNERSGYYSCVDDDIDEVPTGWDDEDFYHSRSRSYDYDYDDNMSPEERKQARQGIRESIDDTWEYMGEEYPIEVKKLHRDYVCGVVDNSIASDIKGELNKLGVDDARTLAKWFIQDRSVFEDMVGDAEEAGDWNILIDYMVDNELSDSSQDAQEFVWEYFDIDNDGGDKYPTYESGDSEEIDSPSEGGSYRIEPDINDFDDTVFSVYFKTYEEDEWEYQKTFNTTEEALAWIDEQIAYGEEHPIVTEANDGEWVDMDDLIGVPQTDPADDASLKTEGFSDFNDDGEDPIISYEDEDGNHSVMVVTGHDEMGETVYQVKIDEEEWTTTSNLEEAKMEAEKLVGKINKRPDADYQLMPVDEAKVVQDVTDVWALLKVLEDDKSSKNLKDLIDSHVRSEEEIMDAVNELYPEDVTQTELNNVFATGMEDIVDALGLDVNAYVKDGSFVDLSKPSTIAAEETDNVVYTVTDIEWDTDYPEDADGLPTRVTVGVPNDIVAAGREDVLNYISDYLSDEYGYCHDGFRINDGEVASEGDEESKPEEVNGDEKKFKGDDGEVKTLDNANKKVVSEMTIEQDINSAEQLERILWGQGKENFIELVSKYGEDEVMSVLEDSGITNLTQMNDYLWFEIDSIEEMLGGTTDDDGAEEL